MRSDARDRLARALAALGERERLLLALTRIDGLDPTEVARVVGGSASEAAREVLLAERKLARRVRVLARSAGKRSAHDRPRSPSARPQEQKERMRWRA